MTLYKTVIFLVSTTHKFGGQNLSKQDIAHLDGILGRRYHLDGPREA